MHTRQNRRRAEPMFTRYGPSGERIGVPFVISDFFASRPSSRPTKTRGGRVSPTAIPIAAEQCASICPGFIFPHSRSLSGRSCASRPM